MSGEHTLPFLHYTPQNGWLTFGTPLAPQIESKTSENVSFNFDVDRVQLLSWTPSTFEARKTVVSTLPGKVVYL